MSIIANNLLQGDEGYNISRSLRFRNSASAYLTRTPSSGGNRKTWSWSGWVKRGSLAGSYAIFGSNYNDAGSQADGTTNLLFDSSDRLDFAISRDTVGVVGRLITTQVFRDPSAWYHIFLVADTTQATSSNRLKLYVNGVQVSSFSTATYPSQNWDTEINKVSRPFRIGAICSFNTPTGVESFLDGYQTEVNFIDGQALTPSSFGETDPITGVWKAKKYGGTYGTNGFYLPFSDNTSTTTLGYDKSGNSNNWTANNISLTAGSTYDSMVDVPTMSALASNYCVANPLAILGNSNVSITNGNLDCTIGVSGQWRSTPASTMTLPSGKWYFEVTQNNATSAGNCGIGILQANVAYTGNYYFWNNAYGFGYNNDGNKVNNNSGTAYGSTWTSAGDVIGVAVDMTTGDLTFYKNGVSQGSAYTFDTTREYFVMLAGASSVPQYSINYGQRPFAYSAPTGYKALNTFNLPEPSIKAGNKHFDVITHIGNGASNRSITGYSFDPDFVWVKDRTGANSHVLINNVVGGAKQLFSNLTNAEQTNTDVTNGFTTGGFIVGSNATGTGATNLNGNAYVDWAWKANGSGSSNTAGSITSTVSANPTAGFSVVTYTSNGVSGATVGHGLGVAPSMIIVKERSTARPWPIYHASIGATKYLNLADTAASATDSTIWNNTAPSSSVFTIGNNTWTNDGSGTYVAYCFSEVAGYSKFGSYTGNGSTDGTFVALPFKPKFIMVKCTNDISHWTIVDRASNPYNVAVNSLYADTSAAENATIMDIDFLSNGFKLRGVLANECNVNGYTYIYAAFAETPTKYALGQ